MELAMEYTGALGTIIFDESCHLCDLTEAQVGRNQFTMDVVVDRLDREVDHALMGSLVSRDRRNSCWDQEEKVWGKRRPVVQQGRRIPALKELS